MRELMHRSPPLPCARGSCTTCAAPLLRRDPTALRPGVLHPPVRRATFRRLHCPAPGGLALPAPRRCCGATPLPCARGSCWIDVWRGRIGCPTALRPGVLLFSVTCRSRRTPWSRYGPSPSGGRGKRTGMRRASPRPRPGFTRVAGRQSVEGALPPVARRGRSHRRARSASRAGWWSCINHTESPPPPPPGWNAPVAPASRRPPPSRRAGQAADGGSAPPRLRAPSRDRHVTERPNLRARRGGTQWRAPWRSLRDGAPHGLAVDASTMLARAGAALRACCSATNAPRTRASAWLSPACPHPRR